MHQRLTTEAGVVTHPLLIVKDKTVVKVIKTSRETKYLDYKDWKDSKPTLKKERIFLPSSLVYISQGLFAEMEYDRLNPQKLIMKMWDTKKSSGFNNSFEHYTHNKVYFL